MEGGCQGGPGEEEPTRQARLALAQDARGMASQVPHPAENPRAARSHLHLSPASELRQGANPAGNPKRFPQPTGSVLLVSGRTLTGSHSAPGSRFILATARDVHDGGCWMSPAPHASPPSRPPSNLTQVPSPRLMNLPKSTDALLIGPATPPTTHRAICNRSIPAFEARPHLVWGRGDGARNGARPRACYSCPGAEGSRGCRSTGMRLYPLRHSDTATHTRGCAMWEGGRAGGVQGSLSLWGTRFRGNAGIRPGARSRGLLQLPASNQLPAPPTSPTPPRPHCPPLPTLAKHSPRNPDAAWGDPTSTAAAPDPTPAIPKTGGTEG